MHQKRKMNRFLFYFGVFTFDSKYVHFTPHFCQPSLYLLWSDHICLLCFEHISSNVLNLLFAMFQTHSLLCFKHMIRYVLSTLFARLRRHPPALFQTRYLMCFKHIIRYGLHTLACYVLDTLFLMF